MKANELRIGNYVLDDDGVMAKINGFKPFGHSVRCDEEEGCLILIDLYRKDGSIGLGYELESFECKPIPLTEEWLERLGFLKSHKKAEWSFGAFRVCKTTDNEFVWPDFDLYYIKLPYVHTMQNLCWSLTGQELTIKED